MPFDLGEELSFVLSERQRLGSYPLRSLTLFSPRVKLIIHDRWNRTEQCPPYVMGDPDRFLYESKTSRLIMRKLLASDSGAYAYSLAYYAPHGVVKTRSGFLYVAFLPSHRKRYRPILNFKASKEREAVGLCTHQSALPSGYSRGLPLLCWTEYLSITAVCLKRSCRPLHINAAHALVSMRPQPHFLSPFPYCPAKPWFGHFLKGPAEYTIYTQDYRAVSTLWLFQDQVAGRAVRGPALQGELCGGESFDACRLLSEGALNCVMLITQAP